ncbi:MAG: hypothetical protein M3Y33_06165, partial [Actinomycetota bacterium]|nr:hypothetical protein [Actinomycetota bacterium]
CRAYRRTHVMLARLAGAPPLGDTPWLPPRMLPLAASATGRSPPGRWSAPSARDSSSRPPPAGDHLRRSRHRHARSC